MLILDKEMDLAQQILENLWTCTNAIKINYILSIFYLKFKLFERIFYLKFESTA